MKKKFINTFLDAPILISDRDRMYLKLLSSWSENPPKERYSTKRLLKVWTEELDGRGVEVLDPRWYRTLLGELIGENLSEDIDNAHQITSNLTKMANAGLSNWGFQTNESIPLPVDMVGSDEMHDYYSKACIFRKYVDKISSMRASGIAGISCITSGNVCLIGDEYVTLLIMKDHQHGYLLSYEQVMMWKDMLWSRFNVYTAIHFGDYHSETSHIVSKCLDWFLECVERYGNRGYELAKQIEALSKAYLIRRTDSVLGENGSYEAMIQVIKDKEEKMSGSTSEMTKKLCQVLEGASSLVTSVEIFGLMKLSGHPTIDPSLGGRSVREIACKTKRYRPHNVQRVRNNFCRLYLEGYIRRKNQWPPLKFDKEGKKTRLYELYQVRELKISGDRYPLKDWSGVRFEKHHDFDYYPNFTDLMDDRAISYYRNEAATTWTENHTPSSQRRLLLELLSKPDFDLKSIIERVRIGDIPFPWLIVSLYPKEREFKIEPRMFAMMVIEMRTVFTALEANWADHIFPYLPQQTMTLPRKEIAEMFHKMTESPADSDYLRLYLEFDLSKWNTEWRAEVIDPINQDAGDMHGEENIFDTIHHFFARCVMLVRVSGIKPPNVEMAQDPNIDLTDFQSDLMWINHVAGVEGIAQKSWTAATYSMIDLALREFNIRYYLIGQGDNQIVLAYVYIGDQLHIHLFLRSLSDRIVRRVKEECSKVGQNAKEEECLASTTVITYSKDVYINGVEYYTTLKSLSRIFPRSASDFPSVNGHIGSMTGQILAAAEHHKFPLSLFSLWAFHTSLYLVYLRKAAPMEGLGMSKPLRKELMNQRISAMLSIPNMLGGLQNLTIPDLLYKSGADPLSKSYAHLRIMGSRSPFLRSVAGALHDGRWFKKEPDQAILLEDPYSLPLAVGSTPENSIINSSKNQVSSVTRNVAIHELTSSGGDDYEKKLEEILLSVRPFNPVLMSDLSSLTVPGVRKTISKMFTATRTIQSLLQGNEDIDVCTTVLSAGNNYMNGLMYRLRNVGRHEYVAKQIFHEISHLRSYWKGKSDLIITGVTTYTPFDMTLRLEFFKGGEGGFRGGAHLNPRGSISWNRGDEEPYMGRETKEKRSVHGYKIITQTTPSRDIKKISDIATQPGVGASFIKLLDHIAATRGRISLEKTLPYLGRVYGGSIDHRYQSRLGFRGSSFLGGTTLPSNCYLYTDEAGPISGGEEDYPIMIQEPMTCILGIISSIAKWNLNEIHVELGIDNLELEPIKDSMINVPEQDITLGRQFIGNPLVYSSEIMLQKTFSTYDGIIIGRVQNLKSLPLNPEYAMRRLLMRALRSNRSASRVADIGTGNIHIHFDLLELRGITISGYLEAASVEVAKFALEGLYARSSMGLRWTPLPLITSLSWALSLSVARMILHPMFNCEDLNLKYFRTTPLRYSPPGDSPRHWLSHDIASRALSMFTNPSSSLYSSPFVTFLDDSDEIMTLDLRVAFMRIIHQAYLVGDLTVRESFTIIRRHLSIASRSAHTLESMALRVHDLAAKLSVWAEETGKVTLCGRLRSFIDKREIMMAGMSAPESLREARQIVHSPDQRQQPYYEKSHDVITPGVLEWRIEPLGKGMIFKSSHWLDPLDKVEYDMFNFRRLSGRIWGRSSSTLYSYLPLIKSTTGKVILVIGCGIGTGPALLLSYGVKHVYASDLVTDMSTSGIAMTNACAPAIASLGYRNQFTRIDFKAGETGRVQDPISVRRMKSYIGEGIDIILDIPLEGPEEIKQSISNLVWEYQGSKISIRIILYNDQIEDISAFCFLYFENMEIIPVYCEESLSEVWISGSLNRTRKTSLARIHVQMLNYNCVNLAPNLSHMKGGEDYLKVLIAGPYAHLTREEVEVGLENLASLMSLTLGQTDHRFSYDQWTFVLHMLLCQEVLNNENPEEMVNDIIRKDITYLHLFKRRVLVSVTTRLRRTLTRVVPRLLTPR